MKGISIAMETIVYIILAVMVLTILLFFLTSQASPAQTMTELQNKRTQFCGRYTQYDSRCDRLDQVRDVPDMVTTVRELLTTCGKLEIPQCGAGGNDQNCIQLCCLMCPSKPTIGST